ncbi:MAG: type II toxin-antitoxin system YafQ family toxin [Dehalococcoidia bacterium]
MRTLSRTSQFKKDAKRNKRRGKNPEKLKEVVERLLRGEELESGYKDHVLQGQYATLRECHIEPDWLLLYKVSEKELILIRTGTHADLFE